MLRFLAAHRNEESQPYCTNFFNKLIFYSIWVFSEEAGLCVIIPVTILLLDRLSLLFAIPSSPEFPYCFCTVSVLILYC